MIINAIRYRSSETDVWQAFKLNSGTGRFRNYQAVVGGSEVLSGFVTALDYLLTGKTPKTAFEAQAQLSDDGGNTWTVHRRPAFVRYLKNGQPVESEVAEAALAGALMDLDSLESNLSLASVQLERTAITAQNGRLSLSEYGVAESPMQSLRDMAERQIGEVAAECARSLKIPSLKDPRRLTKVARKLEPLWGQYRELCRQYKDLGGEAAAQAESDLEELASLTRDLAVAEQIADLATPLLKPGAPTLKAINDELATCDADVAEITKAIGLTGTEHAASHRDFRKAIEALARLEAHAKLVRASQGARKYCEQNVEPLFKRYFEQAESSFANDRQIAAELESCLASLTLRLDHRSPAGIHAESHAASPNGPGLKTWFDRFKSRQVDEPTKVARPESGVAPADLETARMAIEYALGRLSELNKNFGETKWRHESVRGKLDEGHEELVKSYGRLRDHWLQVARDAQLPDELDLNGILRIVSGHGRLVAMQDRRTELLAERQKHTESLTRLGQLVTLWREVSGSQKQIELGNVQVLLQEARDVIRYLEPKRKRFNQLKDAAVALRGAAAIRGHLKARRAELLKAWQEAQKDAGTSGLELQNVGLPELFQRASLIRALALVHGSAAKSQGARLFDGRTEAQAATIYVWDKPQTTPAERLELLNQLEAAQGGELRLLLLADETLGAMLGSLGIGMAQRLKLDGPKAPQTPLPTTGPKAKAAAISAAAPPASPPTKKASPIISDRARRTLDLLNTKPGGR